MIWLVKTRFTFGMTIWKCSALTKNKRKGKEGKQKMNKGIACEFG